MRAPRRNILIVEDDKQVRDALEELLRLRGYEVTSVGSAEDGLAHVRAERFAFIASDCSLPGRDGVFLLNQAALHGHSRQRMALVTANRTVTGAHGIHVIRKPVAAAEVLAFIEERLGAAAPPSGGLRFAASAWRQARALAPLAAAAMVLVLLQPAGTSEGGGFQARGPEKESSIFGIRAFCIRQQDAAVTATASPGEVLRCPFGSALQLTYSSPLPSKLRVRVAGTDLWLFDAEGEAVAVGEGVDVPLSASTVVHASWLQGPRTLHAEFSDAHTGTPLAVSAVEILPWDEPAPEHTEAQALQPPGR